MSCCKQAFKVCDGIPSCITQLLLKTSAISEDVNIKVIDKFNRVYYAEKTTDSNGIAMLQLVTDNTDPLSPIPADFPDSLFNEFAGKFIIQVFGTSGNERPWTISGIQYDGLEVECLAVLPVVNTYTLDPTYADGSEVTFKEV